MRIEKPGDWLTEENADKEHVIRATFLHWVAAHGAMCLALRNPQITRASRQLVIDVIDGIERLFKAEGMPRDELNQIHMIESDAGGVASKSSEEEGDRARRRIQSHYGRNGDTR